MLGDMCPSDVAAFIAAADALVGDSQALTGHKLLQIWPLALLKLPPVVRRWGEICARSGDQGPRAASEYAAACVELAEAHAQQDGQADGKAWARRQLLARPCLFGPIAFLQKLGMTAGCNPATNKRRKTQSEDGPKSSPSTREMRLGTDGQVYIVTNATEIWSKLVTVAEEFDAEHPSGLPLPRDPEQARAFVDAVSGFLRAFPPCFGYAPPQLAVAKKLPRLEAHSVSAGASLAAASLPFGYLRKHILRKFILWAQRKTPASAWASFTLPEIMDVCPDKENHLAKLPDKRVTAEELSRTFGVNAFMISCWACFFGAVEGPALRRVFSRPSAQLRNLAQKLQAEHDFVEPNMLTLAQEYRRSKLS